MTLTVVIRRQGTTGQYSRKTTNGHKGKFDKRVDGRCKR